MQRVSWPLAVVVFCFLLNDAGCSRRANLPVGVGQSKSSVLRGGFAEQFVVGGIPDITTIKFAPDGRLFVAEKTGALRIFKDGQLLAAPFLTVDVGTDGERGLDGLTFDPNFSQNGYLYIYYTANNPAGHNRVSRFTANPLNPDVALTGSEVQLFDIASTHSAFHNGGGLNFLPDGTLTITVGDNAAGDATAQMLTDVRGKVLRINPDGSIPTNNPFYGMSTGPTQAIWALGLRNPFTAAVQPGTGNLFINDVGQDTWEEINIGVAGANFGWPTCEGACSPPQPGLTDPLAAYKHGISDTTGCAITGGAFYNPQNPTFPAEYVGQYFYIDFCSNWIRQLDLTSGNTSLFANGLPPSADASATQVTLEVGPDGALYFANRYRQAIYRIQYTGINTPQIGQDPASTSSPEGHAASFEVRASGAAPLAYQWRRNGASISGANSSTLTVSGVALADSGTVFDCVVTNDLGTATSSAATLTVTANHPPQPVITIPVDGATYNAGDLINYSGSATDPEDGTLPATALTWEVRFQHETHYHPFVSPYSGSTSGSFTIPTTGETDPVVWYRILLTATDTNGATTTIYRDVMPNEVDLTLTTNPPGLALTIDGNPTQSGYSTAAVVNLQRSLSLTPSQQVNGTNYVFDHWSDGGTATHTIFTPSTDTNYIATFMPADLVHYNSAFVSQSVPSSMNAGDLVSVSVTFTNNGQTTWSVANQYRLGSQNPYDNATWGMNRIVLPSDVPPGQTVTIPFAVRAPTVPGQYSFQWRLLQEGVLWFGERTPNVAVDVSGVPANDAQFVSQDVPSSVTPGQMYTASVTMKNTGSATWPAGGAYRLGSQNPADNFTWGMNRVYLQNPVAPGDVVTFSFPIIAPWTDQPTNFQWRMVQENVQWFGASTANQLVSVSPMGNTASFVSESVPTSMIVGQSYNVVVTMRNIGTTTWDPATQHALGAQSPHDNKNWGFNRIYLSNAVPPGGTYAFNARVTAPWTPGNYDFQWRMVQDGVEWFGQSTPKVTIAAVAGSNGALFVSQSVPSTMQAGQQCSVSITMQNIGTSTWDSSRRLGSQSSQDNVVWGANRAYLGSTVPSGQNGTFVFSVTAPTTPGTYSFQWEMLQEGVEWFGPLTDKVLVNVTP